MSQFTWVKGMNSPNKTGRPKGSKRNFKRELERFSARKSSVKELIALYERLKDPSEQLEMLKAIWSYTIPKPTADTLSQEEIDALYQRLEQTAKDVQQQRKAG